jgi:hypothetical protein
MNCNNIPDQPVFNATIKVRVQKFNDVMDRRILEKVLMSKDKDLSVTYNISKTMTKTIHDTMTNANGLFYTEMKELKEMDPTIEKTNDFKDPLLLKLSQDEDSFNAFKHIVLAM